MALKNETKKRLYKFKRLEPQAAVTDDMDFLEAASRRLFALASMREELGIQDQELFLENAKNIVYDTGIEREALAGDSVITKEIVRKYEAYKGNKFAKNLPIDVTQYIINNKAEEYNALPEDVQISLKDYFYENHVTINLSSLTKNIEDQLIDYYLEYGEDFWTKSDLVVNLDDEKIKFDAFSVKDFVGWNIAQTADNIVCYIMDEYEKFDVKFFQGQNWLKKARIKTEKVSIPTIQYSIAREINDKGSDYKKYSQKYPDVEDDKLLSLVTADRKREILKSNPACVFVGEPIVFRNWEQEKNNIVSKIENENLNVVVGDKVMASYMPEYKNVYETLSEKMYALKKQSDFFVGLLKKGLDISDELSICNIPVDINGYQYNVPVADLVLNVEKKPKGKARYQKITVDEYLNEKDDESKYRISYNGSFDEQDIREISSDLIASVYLEGDGLIDKPAEYAAMCYLEEQENRLKKEFNIDREKGQKEILIGKEFCVNNVNEINDIIKKQFEEAVANDELFTSVHSITVDGHEFNTISAYVDKYFEREIDGKIVNVGAGYREVISKVTDEVVRFIETDLSRNDTVVFRMGQTNTDYIQKAEVDLTSLREKARGLVEKVFENPNDFEQALINNSMVSMFKSAELEVNGVSYKVNVNPDFAKPEKHELIAEDLVSQFLEKYITEYGYHENVDIAYEFNAPDEDKFVGQSLVFTANWRNEQLEKIKYIVDEKDNTKLSAIQFPDGSVLEANFDLYPKNHGFNPLFVEDDEKSPYLVSPKIYNSSMAYSNDKFVNIPYDQFSFVYEVTKFKDKLNGYIRDKYGKNITLEQQAIEYRVNRYKENTKLENINNRDYVGVGTGTDYKSTAEEDFSDFIDSIDENYSFDTNKFEITGTEEKEYAGSIDLDFDNNYISEETPENFELMMNTAYDKFVEKGDKLKEAMNGSYLREDNKFVLFNTNDSPFNPKVDLYKEFMTQRQADFPASMEVKKALAFIRNNYEALDSYYKGLISEKNESGYFESFYSRDALVDAMLNIELKHMAVRYYLFEKLGDNPTLEQVQKIENKRGKELNQLEVMKYYSDYNTEEMLDIVSNLGKIHGYKFKGSYYISHSEDFNINLHLEKFKEKDLENYKASLLERLIDNLESPQSENNVVVMPKDYYKLYVTDEKLMLTMADPRKAPTVAKGYQQCFSETLKKELIDAGEGKPIKMSVSELRRLVAVSYSAKELSGTYKADELIKSSNLLDLMNFVRKDCKQPIYLNNNQYGYENKGIITIGGFRSGEVVKRRLDHKVLNEELKKMSGNNIEDKKYHVNPVDLPLTEEEYLKGIWEAARSEKLYGDVDFKQVLENNHFNDASLKTARHVLRYAYPGKDFTSMSKEDFVKNYKVLFKLMGGKKVEDKSYDARLVDHYNYNGSKVGKKEIDYIYFVKKSGDIPPLEETIALAVFYGLESKVAKIAKDENSFTEKAVQGIINDYEDKVFAVNSGVVSDKQKEFFKNFGMEEALNDNNMTYYDARVAIFTKLKEENIISKELVDFVNNRLDIPGLNYDYVYKLTPDSDKLNKLDDKLRKLCSAQKANERQYCIDIALVSDSKGQVYKTPVYYEMNKMERIIAKACSEFQQEEGKPCIAIRGNKLYEKVAEALLMKNMISLDSNNKVLSAEVQNSVYAKIITEVLPSGVKADAKEKCEKIVEKMRDKLEKEGKIKVLPKEKSISRQLERTSNSVER